MERAWNFKDITGRVFTYLTVNKFLYTKNGRAFWECVCKCGNTIITEGYKLNRGCRKSCGCLYLEGNRKTHGFFSGTRNQQLFYGVWTGIKTRCFNINSQNYSKYGGRGITLCDRWLSFENFRDDMWESYLEHGKIHGFGRNTSIERIDVDGNYEPENCEWSTTKKQGFNKRNSTKTLDYITHGRNRQNISILLSKVLQGHLKNSPTLEKYIGCTIREFRNHIASQFEPWMNWENRGKSVSIPLKTWQLDHIVQCWNFDLSKEEDLKRCFHYTNLRPYDSFNNSKENCRI